MAPPAKPESAKVVAEYAKSGRSGCKGCGESIPAGSLRLGIVAKDPRGFEATKWHHLACFKPPHLIGSVEEIEGFSNLHKADQESLKEWESGELVNVPPEKVEKSHETGKRKSNRKGSDKPKADSSDTEEPKGKSTKKSKVDKSDDAGKEKTDKKSSEDPKKVVTDYAKSGKSSCKVCQKPIELGALRLGFSSRDRRGFDMIKWHHPECIRPLSDVIGSIKDIEGFAALKSHDQEMLKKLDSSV